MRREEDMLGRFVDGLACGVSAVYATLVISTANGCK